MRWRRYPHWPWAAALLLSGGFALSACSDDTPDPPPDVPSPRPAPAAPPPAPPAPEPPSPPALDPPEALVEPLAVAPLVAHEEATHVVAPGDTLGKIAVAFGTTVEAIVERNELPNRDLITVGQTLVIPIRPAIVPPTPRAGDLVLVEVVRAVDGDTIDVRFADGRQERVRYVGVDAPEVTEGVEQCGPEAGERNAELLTAGRVFLEADSTDRDRFSRLLRYVWVEETKGALRLVNGALVALGLAEATPLPPDVRYEELFTAAQGAAQAQGLGIWAEAPACPS